MTRLFGSVLGTLMLTAIDPAGAAATVASAGPPAPAEAGAASRAERPSTEVEAVVAVGDGTGTTGFGCGSQQTRVRYVVGAAEVRRTARPVSDPRGSGFTIVAGGAFEGGEEQILEEPRDSPGRAGFIGTFGTHLRIGHHSRWVGAEGGIGALVQWPGAARGDEWAFPYPDVRLSIGPREFVHFFVGVGNSQPSSMAVGWPYGGLGWAPSRALRLEGRFALETVHATVQLRGDLTSFVRVSPHVSLRFGAGVGQSVDSTLSVPFSGEGNLGVVLIP